MEQHYVSRTLEGPLASAAREFPAIVVTGPRQAGKTTLLRRLFGTTHKYVSLDPPDVRAAAIADPRGFLDLWPEPVILDEIQHAPDLLPYIKERIDEHRSRAGRFVLSGSQNLLLMERVSESLAGRTAVLRLLPLSRREILGQAGEPAAWEKAGRHTVAHRRLSGAFWQNALRGGYPEIALNRRRDITAWFGSFVQTYLERDVRTIRNVGDLTQFQIFLRALAARSGQLLNFADFGRDLGLALNTVKAWISVLEATHQILILRPYHANVGKRLVKTPKVYFTDTGLLCHLSGIRDFRHAADGPMAGVIVETAAVVEITKRLVHRGEEPRLFFWRTSTGEEVDVLVETATGLLPLEVKATATPTPPMARGILRLRESIRGLRPDGYVVNPGNNYLPLGNDVFALPFDLL